MPKIRCKFCKAKPRSQFAVTYAGHEMCADCKWEYQAILEGKVSKQFAETLGDNPLEEKKKWGLEGLDRQCSESLRMWNGYYNEEMINRMKDFKFNIIKRIDDGISEDS